MQLKIYIKESIWPQVYILEEKNSNLCVLFKKLGKEWQNNVQKLIKKEFKKLSAYMCMLESNREDNQNHSLKTLIKQMNRQDSSRENIGEKWQHYKHNITF